MPTEAEPRQIFEYLWALKNLTSPPKRRIQEYDWVLPLNELPTDCGCHAFGAGAKDPESWLEVHRQVIPLPPEPADLIRDWLTRYDDENAEPQPLTDREVPGPRQPDGTLGAPVRERFDADERRVDAYLEWCTDWDTWAEQTKPKRRVQQIYANLFAWRQRFEREGEMLEIAFGHGMLQWTVGGVLIERPVLVTRADLLFDARQGVFWLKPTSRGTALETEMLSGLDISTLQDVARMERGFREAPVDPLDRQVADAYLTELAHTLDPNGRYDPAGDTPTRAGVPVIRPRPVLFVRRRADELWKQELRTVLQALDDGYKVPETIRTLITSGSGGTPGTTDGGGDPTESRQGSAGNGVASPGAARRAVPEDDLLFPLPSNEDQREIARRLAMHEGVTVQGPPGTGKSHTIANLICHLLAQGKRVLVTSHTEKALRVLKDKIPEDIRALCVPLLGGDRQSLQDIESAIRAIHDNLSSLDPAVLEAEMVDLARETRDTREQIADLRRRLRSAAEQEHATLSWQGAPLPRVEIAKRVGLGAERHGWFPDSVPVPASPPLSDEEMRRLWELLGAIPRGDREEAALELPDPATLTLPEQFSDWIQRGATLAAGTRQAEEAGRAFSIPQTREALQPLRDLAAPVARERELFAREHLRQVLADALGSPDRGTVWTDLIAEVRRELPEVGSLRTRLAAFDIRSPEGAEREAVARDLEVLATAFELGKPGTLFFLTTGRRLKYLLEGRWVDGRGADTKERVQALREHIRLLERRERLARRWNTLLSSVGGPEVQPDNPRLSAVLDDQTKLLEQTIVLGDRLGQLRARFAEARLPDAFDWTSWEQLEPLVEAIQGAEATVALREWEGDWRARLEHLTAGAAQPGAARIWRTLASAVRDKDASAWRAAYERARSLHATASRSAELQRLLDRLRPMAPRWTAQLAERVGDPGEFPWEWRQAWEWSQLNGWLASTDTDVKEIEQAMGAAEDRLRRLIASVVSKATWSKQIRRVTGAQRGALLAWKSRIDRIGKGTGTHVARHRADAQREMESAQGAIPVWIMPIHRVIENLRLTNERFDVVIVDESSQCDVFSLVALLRANKAVIVGDDQQISPPAVGTPETEVRSLIERHLAGVPHHSSYDLQTSLYEHARRAFPDTIMLQEHFRCVPEIIQFSNDLAYDGKIIPLRSPHPAERIDPPVLARRVSGFCDELTGSRNEPEADAIVADIREMLEDSRFDGLTMGVVSLVGSQQAVHIQERLHQEIGEEAMEERRLVCGDAYAFQGDERDIMFLSLVSAPKTNASRADQAGRQAALQRRRQQGAAPVPAVPLRGPQGPEPGGHALPAAQLLLEPPPDHGGAGGSGGALRVRVRARCAARHPGTGIFGPSPGGGWTPPDRPCGRGHACPPRRGVRRGPLARSGALGAGPHPPEGA